MSLIGRLLKANPSAQVSDMLTGYFVIPSAKQAFNDTSTRAVFGGGNQSGHTNTIEYSNITTTMNALDFGDLTVSRFVRTASASSTRALFWGGYHDASGNTDFNTIDYVTIATVGNATDFGDMLAAQFHNQAHSSETRSVEAGGYRHNGGGAQSVIQYVTIASTGNATTFGNISGGATLFGGGGSGSTTRGIYAYGNNPSGTERIEYVTIATTGDSVNFGNRTVIAAYLASASNSTRSCSAGGGNYVNVIDYVTIATTGNATDFGDLTIGKNNFSGTSSSTRAIFVGGQTTGGAFSNVIDYITIDTTGNATDYGDLSTNRADAGATSNSHGGL